MNLHVEKDKSFEILKYEDWFVAILISDDPILIEYTYWLFSIKIKSLSLCLDKCEWHKLSDL